jgi:hypothetical protein
MSAAAIPAAQKSHLGAALLAIMIASSRATTVNKPHRLTSLLG